jgi:hypothetical protein
VTEVLGSGIIIVFPLTTALYKIYPLDFVNKNAYLLFVYFVAVAVILLNNRALLNNHIARLAVLLLFFSFLILIIRTVLFQQTSAEVFENRIILSFPFFFILAYCVGQSNFSSTRNSFLVSISIIAFLGIIRSFFFPSLFIGEGIGRDEIVFLEEGVTPREFSIIGSPNAYGVLVCMGLYFIAFKGIESYRNFLYIALFTIFFVAVFLSESRFPSLLAILFLISYLGGRGLQRYRIVLLVAVLMAFSFLVFDNFQGAAARLGQGEDRARVIKAQLSLDLIFQSLESVIIGVPFQAVADASYDSITISDNSILAVGMASGFFIMLVQVLFAFFLIWRSQHRIAIGFLSLSYLLYNAIYWDVAVFYLSLLYVWFSPKRPDLSSTS